MFTDRPLDVRHVPGPIYLHVEGEHVPHQAVWLRTRRSEAAREGGDEARDSRWDMPDEQDVYDEVNEDDYRSMVEKRREREQKRAQRKINEDGTGGKPLYCDSRYYKILAGGNGQGGVGCSN